MSPRRVQMTRRRPWRADHPNAVIVDRRTRWGNPYRVGDLYRIDLGDGNTLAGAVTHAAGAVALYRRYLDDCPELVGAARAELAGRDLACWCPLPEPGESDHCHAATLLRLANERTDR